MTDRATAQDGGQAAVGDINNSTHHIAGSVGVIGDGATGNVFIENLHVHVQLHHVAAAEPMEVE